jgi:hypothetical protein
MKLREIAYARSGDKGDVSNICVFPYNTDDWPEIKKQLTVEQVRAKFGSLVRGDIVRYEVESLRGLNFVLYQALAGGVSISLRTDPHGKSFQSLMLDIDL